MGLRPCRGRPALVALAALALAAGPIPAAATVGDVDIALTVEIIDAAAWHTLHAEVLATAREAPKPLGLGVAATTGGERWLSVVQPVFSSRILTAGPGQGHRVTVTGKVAGPEAVRGLVPFEQSVAAMQAGILESRVTLAYGLSSLTARLLELRLTRP